MISATRSFQIAYTYVFVNICGHIYIYTHIYLLYIHRYTQIDSVCFIRTKWRGNPRKKYKKRFPQKLVYPTLRLSHVTRVLFQQDDVPWFDPTRGGRGLPRVFTLPVNRSHDDPWSWKNHLMVIFNRKILLMDKILHHQGWWLSHYL